MFDKTIIMKTGLPVDFSITINEKTMDASLVSIEDTGVQKVFVVHFADGYEDGFYLDNMVRGVNEKQSIPYAEALKDEIPVFNFLKQDIAVKNFKYGIEGAFANAWIFRTLGRDMFYYTFYLQGDYVFDLYCDDGVWATCIHEKLCTPGLDHPLVHQVIKEIGKEPFIENKPAPSKSIEFPLMFDYQGQQMIAQGILVETQPVHQCYVAVRTEDLNNTMVYQFLKVNQKDKVFSWNPAGKKKEKMAKAIAGALEKMFSTARFSRN